jgi:hypothetical protein
VITGNSELGLAILYVDSFFIACAILSHGSTLVIS